MGGTRDPFLSRIFETKGEILFSDPPGMKLQQHHWLGTVWKELRRRKVFQVAFVYVLMGWGVMQVGELLFEALRVPEGAYTLLVILVLLGFPVAVVLAWAYEVTPEGVRRDIVQELRRQQLRPPPGGCPRQDADKVLARVAILPLRDMAPGHDLSYFCDGLAEEIQNALCKVDGLEVIARAHSFQYGGKKIALEKIRRELGATAIIEGSVRRSDGVFRISIQLVDVESSTDIWSKSREVSLDNEFSVQKCVASDIARHTQMTFIRSNEQLARDEQLHFEHF
jgi:TolB-like protein